MLARLWQKGRVMAVWVRFHHAAVQGWGVLTGGQIAVHDAAPYAGGQPTGQTLDADTVTLLAPAQPQVFLGLWNNFRALAEKQGNGIPDFPLYFLKSPGSIIGPNAAIRPPASYTGRVVYEAELGVVIGKTCTDVDEAAAEAAICGYTCINDVTAAELFGDNPGFSQWARAKGCDSFGPVGPVLVTDLDWRAATIRTLLNGRERQSYPAADMIIPPARIISLISREMTLRPGDLIACGTSLGVLPMRPGMVVEVAIDGIGVLRNSFAPD